MTAQYRPYRDEETFEETFEDGHQSLSTWDNQEPGTIQIYEKTTEEIPIGQQRRLIAYAVILVIMSLFVGFLFGQMNSTKSTTTVNSSKSSLNPSSLLSADWSSHQYIIDSIDSKEMKDFLSTYSKKPRLPSSKSDSESIEILKEYFKKYNLDKVEINNYSALLSLPDESKPNFVSIMDNHLNQIVFNSLNDSNSSDKFSEYSAYSPARSVKVCLIN